MRTARTASRLSGFFVKASLALVLAGFMSAIIALVGPVPDALAISCKAAPINGGLNFRIDSEPSGYWLWGMGTIKCDGSVPRIRTELQLVVNGQVIATASQDCIRKGRCPETYLMWISCPQGKCPDALWEVRIGGSWRDRQGRDHRVPMQRVGRPMLGPKNCKVAPRH